MGRGDTVGLLRAWLGGGCWVSLPRGPLPALGFMTGGSWFSFGSFGLWGWRLPRHCPHSRGGGGSWWRAAGRRGWAVGWGRGGQRPAGARVWLGQAGQDGGRWEPRVRREQAGGVRPRWGSLLSHQKLGSPWDPSPGPRSRADVSAGSAAQSPAGGRSTWASVSPSAPGGGWQHCLRRPVLVRPQ